MIVLLKVSLLALVLESALRSRVICRLYQKCFERPLQLSRFSLTCVSIFFGVIFVYSPAFISLIGIWLLVFKSLSSFKKGRQQKNRSQAIQQSLPHFFDLISLYLRGGVSLVAALKSLSEMSMLGPLAAEIKIATNRMQAGETVEKSLNHLAAKYPSDEMEMTTQTLINAYNAGVAVTPTLDALAQQFAQIRAHQAEQRAQRLPFKLLLPLFTCIFPSTLVLLGYPIVRFAQQQLS